jgi:spore maturation protein CgeB
VARGFKIGILNFRENLFDVFLKSFKSLGHEVEIFQLDKANWESCENWLTQNHFDLYLTGNFVAFHYWKHGSHLEKWIAEKQTPLMVWHWEKIFFSGDGYLKTRLEKTAIPKNFLFFVTDCQDIETLKSYSIRAHYLPLAVDDDLQHFAPTPEHQKKFSHDVVFSGTPFTLESVYTSDEAEFRRGFVVNNLLEFYSRAKQQLGISPPSPAKNNEILQALNLLYSVQYPNYSAFDEAFSKTQQVIFHLVGEPLGSFFAQYQSRLAYIYSYFQTSVYLKQLQEFGIRIYGSEGWRNHLTDYPFEIPRLSDNDFYGCLATSKITFCITKLQFHEFLHERSMMALACGGFPITDHRQAIEALFESDELVSYRSFEEAKNLIRFYLQNESERQKISAKGRARVLSSHRYQHRVQRMLQVASDYFQL